MEKSGKRIVKSRLVGDYNKKNVRNRAYIVEDCTKQRL